MSSDSKLSDLEPVDNFGFLNEDSTKLEVFYDWFKMHHKYTLNAFCTLEL